VALIPVDTSIMGQAMGAISCLIPAPLATLATLPKAHPSLS